MIRKFIEKEDGKFYEIITSSGFPYMHKRIGIEVSNSYEQEIETTIRDFPIDSQVKFAHLDYWCEIVKGCCGCSEHKCPQCSLPCSTYYISTVPYHRNWKCMFHERTDGQSVIAKRIEG